MKVPNEKASAQWILTSFINLSLNVFYTVFLAASLIFFNLYLYMFLYLRYGTQVYFRS